MARSRNIKPGFFTNDDLAECGPLGHLLFSGLWVIADREGRLQDRPKKIKAEVLPYYEADVDALLTELDRHGFVRRYQANGSRFIQIINWKKHQTPHVKESPSEIPSPDESETSPVQESVSTEENTELAPPDSLNLIPDSGFRIVGRETNGADAPPPAPSKPNSRSKPKTPVPKTFHLTTKHYEAGAELGLSREDIERETKKFVAHYQAHGTPMKDWQAAWNNWMLKVDDFRPKRRNGADDDVAAELDHDKYRDGRHLTVKGRMA